MAPAPSGLRAGLEVHQQLDTRGKLFCRCPTRPREPSGRSVEFLRLLRPTAGEAGRVDVAALEESRRARRFRYLGYDTTCLVEYDEEPPRELNREALEAALQAALLLGMEPVEEVHVMRKAVLDGSNTTGFQRTALVATGGAVKTPAGPVRLTTLCLEEDAAAIVGQEGDVATYSLDRLGVPLVEIATEPDIRSPAQAREAARAIGMVLRSTGLAKRGLGTVRQDVNVSVEGGARVEIKGVQELRLVEKVVAAEAERQQKLIELRSVLQERKAGIGPVADVTFLEPMKAICLRGFAGSQPILERDFFAIARLYGGLLTSDRAEHRDRLKAGPHDWVVGVQSPRASEALERVRERAALLLSRVSEETRRALEDGSTEFLRPLPGAARMYPETDVRPVSLTPALLNRIRQNLPEPLEVKQRKLMEKYSLNEQLAMAALERAELFEAWMAVAQKVPATQVLRVIMAIEKILPALEKASAQNEISLKTLPLSIRATLENPQAFSRLSELRINTVTSQEIRNFPTFLKQMSGTVEQYRTTLQKYTTHDLRAQESELERTWTLILPQSSKSDADARAVVERIIREKAALVREKGEGVHGPLMGLAMKELRGKADGALVARLLRESIEALLKST